MGLSQVINSDDGNICALFCGGEIRKADLLYYEI
jgi:hypothetical protein